MGGPLPSVPIQLQFKGRLANRDVPQVYTSNSLTGQGVGIIVETLRGGMQMALTN
jgi:hypothetical protein